MYALQPPTVGALVSDMLYAIALPLQVAECSKQSSQRWVKEYTEVLHPADAPTLCMDVGGMVVAYGANVQVWQRSLSPLVTSGVTTYVMKDITYLVAKKGPALATANIRLAPFFCWMLQATQWVTPIKAFIGRHMYLILCTNFCLIIILSLTSTSNKYNCHAAFTAQYSCGSAKQQGYRSSGRTSYLFSMVSTAAAQHTSLVAQRSASRWQRMKLRALLRHSVGRSSPQ